jgi:hypothetical protein
VHRADRGVPRLVRGSGRLLAALAATSYAAYILHLYLVITLQFEIAGLRLPVVAKFAIVAVLGIVLAYGLAMLSRAIPGVRVILGATPTASRTTRRQSTDDLRSADPARDATSGRPALTLTRGWRAPGTASSTWPRTRCRRRCWSLRCAGRPTGSLTGPVPG